MKFCWLLCSWISNTTVQITRRSVCRQIQNLAPIFVTPWPTSWTLVDVLDVLRLRARCSQAMSNLQILDIFPLWASTTLLTHLIRVPEEGLTLQLPISSHGWATTTQSVPKTRPHQESFGKNCMGGNFLPNHTIVGGSAGHSPATFFRTSLSVSGIICTTFQCSRMSRNALRSRATCTFYE